MTVVKCCQFRGERESDNVAGVSENCHGLEKSEWLVIESAKKLSSKRVIRLAQLVVVEVQVVQQSRLLLLAGQKKGGYIHERGRIYMRRKVTLFFLLGSLHLLSLLPRWPLATCINGRLPICLRALDESPRADFHDFIRRNVRSPPSL